MEWLGYPTLHSYKDLNITSLPLNHAWVLANTSIQNVSVFSLRDDCFNCPYKLEKHLTPNKLEYWQVDAGHLVSWRITNQAAGELLKSSNRRGWLCQMRPTFNEYGVYRLDVGTCQVNPEVQPIHAYYPLVLFVFTLLAICSTYTGISYLLKRRRINKEIKETQGKSVLPKNNEATSVTTIDVYRGILLALIIFLTTGGGGYPIFNNDWGGLTIAECVFFAYIWSIGVKIPEIMNKAFKENTKWSTVKDIFFRAIFLIILGTAIDSTVENQHSNLRLWCPLQKIGIAYLVVAPAYLLTVQRFEMKSKKLICKVLSNIVCLLWCWIIAAFTLAILTILISTSASFNCLSNTSLRNSRAEDMSIIEDETLNCNNEVSMYANRIFVGEPSKTVNINNFIGFSRGLLGTICTVNYMMTGLKFGVVYLNYKTHSDRLKLWFIWATLFSISGVCFAVITFPLNFNLWPIAAIVFVSTIATYIFAVVYLATEVFHFTSRLMSSLGVTSLVVLSGHMLFSNTLPFMWGVTFYNHLLYMLQNLWILCLWLIVAVLLKRRNINFEI